MSLTQSGPFNLTVHTNLSYFAHTAQLFLGSQVATLKSFRRLSHLWKPFLHFKPREYQALQSVWLRILLAS